MTKPHKKFTYLNSLVRVLYKDDPSLALPFFRISISFFAILHILLIREDYKFFYFQNSLIPSDLNAIYSQSSYSLEFCSFISHFLNIKFDITVSLVIYVYILFCLLLFFGILSRISAFIALILQLCITKSSSLFIYGVDYFTTMSLFYCFVFPVGKTYSIISYIFKTSFNVATIYKTVFKIHLSLIYFFSGLGKALGINWWNGEAIWKSFHLPSSNNDFQIPFTWLANFPTILTTLGITVILLELLYPIFINLRRTKIIWLASIILMHFTLAIILGLYMFSTLMIIWNLTAYYFDKSPRSEKFFVRQ